MKVRVFFLIVAAAAFLTHPGLVRANSPKQKAQNQNAAVSDALANAQQQAATSLRSIKNPYADTNLRGWEHLAVQLVDKEGIDSGLVKSVFSDERMPERESLFFSVEPKEPSNPYRQRLRSSEITNALSFYRKNWFYFRQASMQYQIPESVILAILQIETRCGDYVGNSRVLYRLARLASAAAPGNPLENFEKKRRGEDITLQ
ncbi:MAG: lytic murein transglycosylase, partial [Bdellovibrionales bacterium]|nr:lytic murein transglycosylase [Bdellovibrionales bacterium]